MNARCECALSINGFDILATYPADAVRGVFIPLLEMLTALQLKKGGRLIACLAAPPGAGKTTLAAYLERLSCRRPGLVPLQALGLDGFHYHTDYILSHTVARDGVQIPMREVKGCPESFDVEKLNSAITSLRGEGVLWPQYDRRLHDVIEHAIPVTKSIVLIEGNWLLLNEGRWPSLRRLCDYSILLRADEALLRDRLIERKTRGGLTPDEAHSFYEKSDQKNIARCLQNSRGADRELTLQPDGRIAPI